MHGVRGARHRFCDVLRTCVFHIIAVSFFGRIGQIGLQNAQDWNHLVALELLTLGHTEMDGNGLRLWDSLNLISEIALLAESAEIAHRRT